MPDLARSLEAADADTASRVSTRRGYRFRRRHRLHFYAVVSGVSGAIVVCIVNAIGYLTRDIQVAEIGFGCVLITAAAIFLAFFLGFTMLMSGYIPARRIKLVVPHGAVGMLSPLLYTINISIDLDQWARPVSGAALGCSVACLALLGVQVAMGRAVVRPDPIRIVR
jgi:hypothetical protein